MIKANRLKRLILAASIIASTFVLATAASSGLNYAYVADGAAIYQSKCSTCHGKDGRGIPNWRAKGQPDFTDAGWQKSRTDAQIADVTKNGKGKFMPAFKTKLTDEEISAVVAKVRAFGKK